MKTLFKYYGPAILWALFIFTMCSINIGSEGLSPIFFPGFDKLVHCGFFFVLVVFCFRGQIRQHSTLATSYKPVIIITVSAMLFGGLIELLQLTVFTWRDGDWGDFFADSVGAIMATFSVIITLKAMDYGKK